MSTMHTKATYLFLAAVCVPFAAAQSSSQKPVKGMASTVGLYVYPQKQQSATQQLTDEQQCYGSAKTQTGFDPNATTTAAKSPKPASGGNDHAAAKGALRGATVSRAVGGDPGQGAARGAILGSVRAKHKAKEQSEQADKKADTTNTQQQQKQDNFKRAMSACLDARGYSVR
jgi:hypothetical protein